RQQGAEARRPRRAARSQDLHDATAVALRSEQGTAAGRHRETVHRQAGTGGHGIGGRQRRRGRDGDDDPAAGPGEGDGAERGDRAGDRANHQGRSPVAIRTVAPRALPGQRQSRRARPAALAGARMQLTPSFENFERAFAAYKPVLVWTSFVSDLETPVSAMLKLADGRPNSFLFESVEGGATRGRYSFIGLKPDLIWRCFGDRAEINRRARSDPGAFLPHEGAAPGALQSLRAIIAECRVDTPEPLPPMAAGLFGYMGYGMVGLMEKLPDSKPDRLGIPDGLFVRPTIVCVFDNIADRVTAITPVWPDAAIAASAAYALACERLADTLAEFDRNLPYRREAAETTAELPPPDANMTRAHCMDMVERAKEYIRAGEVFQVVPSMRFSLPFRLP